MSRVFAKWSFSMLGAAWLTLACLAAASAATAQPTAHAAAAAAVPTTAATASTAPPATPVDPLALGRETPRGTVVGFIRAAQAEKYDDAIQFFDPKRRLTPTQDKEFAEQLLAILNARFSGSLDSVPDTPQLARDQVVVGVNTGRETFPLESFPLELVREDDHGARLWFISWRSLEQVPIVYDSLRFPQIESRLPRFLVRTRPLGLPLWQWLAIVFFAPVALLLGWVVVYVGWTVRQLFRRARGLPLLPAPPHRRIGPGTVVVATIIHYNFVRLIGASLLYQWYYRRFILIALSIVAYWALTRITYWISCIIWNNLTSRNLIAERSLISLGRRALDVGVFVAIGLYVLTELDANVPAALAGLGIGGLAIGFGAQKTFENLLGGISILTDKAIVVGDPCKIGDQRGVVEDIGLRSTKLRTEERTLVSIPNGTVATATLENFRWRDKILCRQAVRLRYDLSSDHLRYVLGQLRDILARHPKVEAATARVRVLKLGEYAIEVEIYGYLLVATYAEFLTVQEELILRVMETLESTGAAVALPSQTTLVTQDQWVDPAKARAAQRAMERSRERSEGHGDSGAHGESRGDSEAQRNSGAHGDTHDASHDLVPRQR